MRIGMPGAVAVFSVACLFGFVPAANGQDSVTARVVAHHPEDTTYEVEIRGQRFLAISGAKARRLLNAQDSLAALKLTLADRDAMLALRSVERTLSDSALVHCKQYAFELDTLYRGYRSLADGYRRLARGALVTFDGGLGASGGDRRPAVLLGLGISRVRLWGMFQERNSGGFIGASLRIF